MRFLNGKTMAGNSSDMIKAVIKIGTAIVSLAFGKKVAEEGYKNAKNWKESRNQNTNK
jgi:hypothetical protein